MGQVVKDGKAKGGAWEDRLGGGGKNGEWAEKRVWTREEIDAQDLDFGYDKFVDGVLREGWLITFSPTTITHPETNKDISVVECYLTMQVSAAARASTALAPCHPSPSPPLSTGRLQIQVPSPSQALLLCIDC